MEKLIKSRQYLNIMMLNNDPAGGIKSWHRLGKYPLPDYRQVAKDRLANWMSEQMDSIMFKTLIGGDSKHVCE